MTPAVPSMYGLQGAKLPVRDIDVTTEWYARVFGWTRVFEFPDATGALAGVGGRLPGPSPMALAFHRNPTAQAQEGLEISVVVETVDDLNKWVEHLDRQAVPHSPIIDATISWLVA